MKSHKEVSATSGRASGRAMNFALKCPNKKCEETFMVNRKRLLAIKEERGIHAVVCPYCSRTSFIPGYER